MQNEVIRVGQIQVRYLVDGSDKGGLGVFEIAVPPGAHAPPPHSHDRTEECVYVLEGVLRYSVDGETKDLRAGDSMSSPAGSVHAWANAGEGTARALIICTPDIGVGYFREVAALVNSDSGGPPDRAKLGQIMARHGLSPAAPRGGAA